MGRFVASMVACGIVADFATALHVHGAAGEAAWAGIAVWCAIGSARKVCIVIQAPDA